MAEGDHGVQIAPVFWQLGLLERLVEKRPGCSIWDVRIEATEESGPQASRTRALSCDSLIPEALQPGQRVWLNRTAARLDLGTGGLDFILSVASDSGGGGRFAGRESGHGMKLRYTPLQHRVSFLEESAEDAGRYAAAEAEGLLGTPVVAAELLSQAAVAAIAARKRRPDLRIGLVWIDTASLCVAHSTLVPELKAAGVFAVVVSAGQAFGGDLEAVGIHSALVAARGVAGCGLIIAGQGPGVVGTGSRYGFGGLALAEVLHATAALGGRPYLAARMSAADPRTRHQGLSRHTLAIGACLHVPVTLPLPVHAECPDLPDALHPYRTPMPDVREILGPWATSLRTMGRSVEDDPLFFQAAAAAGWVGAGVAVP